MNCHTCLLTPKFNYVHKLNTVTDIKKSNIDTNLKALMFMIIKEKYYKKLIENVEKAATYQKENKRFYMNFYDFDTHSSYKMDSRDIFLAKNKIFTNDSYKQYLRYKLFNDGYTNITSYIDAGNCSSNKNNLLKFNRYEYNKEGLVYNKNHLSCSNDCIKQLENLGYCSVSNKDLDNYIDVNSKSNNSTKDCTPCESHNKFDKIYLNENDINNKSYVYQKFYNEYRDACYYSSFIRGKINYIKNSSLQARTSNMCVKFTKDIFPNLPNNQLKKIYSGQGIIGVYNSIIQRMS